MVVFALKKQVGPRNPYQRGKAVTVDLLVLRSLTCSKQLLSMLNTNIFFFFYRTSYLDGVYPPVSVSRVDLIRKQSDSGAVLHPRTT